MIIHTMLMMPQQGMLPCRAAAATLLRQRHEALPPWRMLLYCYRLRYAMLAAMLSAERALYMPLLRCRLMRFSC